MFSFKKYPIFRMKFRMPWKDPFFRCTILLQREPLEILKILIKRRNGSWPWQLIVKKELDKRKVHENVGAYIKSEIALMKDDKNKYFAYERLHAGESDVDVSDSEACNYFATASNGPIEYARRNVAWPTTDKIERPFRKVEKIVEYLKQLKTVIIRHCRRKFSFYHIFHH